MDMGFLALLIPIIGVSIPVVAIVMTGKQKIAKMQLEEARLRAQGGGGEGVYEDLEELREEMGHLRGELGEMQERLDFTERMLAQSRERPELPPG